MIDMIFPVLDIRATGRNIDRLRRTCGYTVKELQTFLGLAGPQAIYQWQWGRHLPSVDHLYAISTLFGVPIEQIIVPRNRVSRVIVNKAIIALFPNLFSSGEYPLLLTIHNDGNIYVS
ncbi:MAG: helix-turn-helix domain-containing protein [Clostridiales Family XIII bacterium]|jgi:DNA-binding XRE family transcriptional regulator|nr:helix-turn-helix domain-containing protein [Clostridiales Family XIII bacterium]